MSKEAEDELDPDYRATELDCRVAATVMGWRFWKHKERDQVFYSGKGELPPWEWGMTGRRSQFERLTPAQASRMEFHDKPPRFSRKIKYAWEALKKVSPTKAFAVARSGGQWTACFGTRKATAKTAAKAICLAILGSRKERTK